MFGLFKSASFSDPSLGDLVHSRGFWRGTLQLDAASTPIALAGTRKAPNPEAIAVARELRARVPAWCPAIETALFQHYAPYAEASAAGEFQGTNEPFPHIASPAEVWRHVSLEFVSISPLAGVLATELGYATAWDEEHIVAARFENDRLVELCGSVLPP